MTTKTEILNQKIQTADEHHAQYPQYKGHFDGYSLARMASQVKTKAGVAAKKGDVVIAKLDTAIFPGESRVVFYSENNKCDTVVHPRMVRFL
jgi:hypothetical protein